MLKIKSGVGGGTAPTSVLRPPQPGAAAAERGMFAPFLPSLKKRSPPIRSSAGGLLAAVGRAPTAPFWLKQVQAAGGHTDLHAWVRAVSPFPHPICYPSLAGSRCSGVTNAERMLARSEAASLGVGSILLSLFLPLSTRSRPQTSRRQQT